jgi:hypothetical protein
MGNGNRSNGYGDEGSSNGDGDTTPDGDGNKGWQATKSAMEQAARAMMMAKKSAMATAAKVMAAATKKAMATVGEGDVDDGKSDGRQRRRG